MVSQQMFESFDGTKLFLQKDQVNPQKGVVVIVHGLCEHCARYDYVTKRLNDEGFSVYRFDHRGHGRSEGKKVYYDHYTQISDDVYAVIALAKKENPKTKLFIIGHSMGGYAVTGFATRFPGETDGIILSGALTRYNTPCAGDLPLPLDVDTYVPNALGDGVCSDPAVVEAYANDPLVEKEISVGLLNSLWDGISYLKKEADRFVDPVIILHGANDGLVAEQDSRELFSEISSTDKTLKIYAHLFHEIFNEPTKDEVVDDVLLWLKKHL